MRTRIEKYFLVAVLGLAIAALLATPAVYAKDTVTRPFHIMGQLTFLDAFGAPPWTVLDLGIASMLGRFVDVGKFEADGSGFGIFYAADGDQLFYKPTGPNSMKFIGGTGQFENATGSFTYTMSEPEYMLGPEGTTTIIVMYRGEGTITMGKNHPKRNH
jgi:hypothetical protein